MQKHKAIVILVALITTIVPLFSQAAGFTNPFGGRVLSTTIPSVTCFGTGTGPVVLASNLAALGSAVQGGTPSSVFSGIYGAVPLYTTSTTKVPKAGQWILGRHELIPNLSTCTIGNVPFPVKKTTNYGVSGGSGFNSFGR